MAKKKQDELTPRQRQSRQIMRDKAARKRRQFWQLRLLIGCTAVCMVIGIGGGSWLVFSNAGQRTWAATVDGAYTLSARAGLAVQAIYLEGRNRTAMEDIEKALGIKRGDSILRVNLDEARARLEHVESVHFAAVERALPNAIYVRVVEREPVALWQHQGKLSLVDDKGSVMSGLDIAPYKQLPLIVGDDAPAHIGELMGILAADADLARQFAAAVRVGDRRWNIKLVSGIEVKLPETQPEAAWKILAEMESRQKLLDRAVKVIDLRMDGRLFITVAPQDMPRRAAGAKET